MENELSLDEISRLVKKGLTELLEQANLKKGSTLVLGCSTSEIRGVRIGKGSNLDIGKTVIRTMLEVLDPLGIYLAVQGCEHLNRACVVEREIAEKKGWEIVTVFPALHAGGACQCAAFMMYKDPVEVEHVLCDAGMDIGDTSIGMDVKFVQIPVRTSVKEIGGAHVTYLRSRPKLIGGERAQYKFDKDLIERQAKEQEAKEKQAC